MDYYTLFIPHFLKQNVNCAEIARITNQNERTVQRYFEKFRKLKLIPKKVEIGRPKKYPATINTRIGQIVNLESTITSQKIANKLNEKSGFTISSRTVRRRLETMEYNHSKAIAVPDLKEHQIKQRNEFYRNYKNLDWKTVIFSDESTFQLNPNIVKHWKKKGSGHICRDQNSLKK